MITKLISVLLVVLLVQNSALAQDQMQASPQSVQSMQQVLQKAQKKHKLIKITLVKEIDNRRKITGTVMEVSNAGFTMIESRTGTTIKFAYEDVRQVQQKGLSTATTIVIGLGVAVGVLVAIFYAVYPKT